MISAVIPKTADRGGVVSMQTHGTLQAQIIAQSLRR
jgi:hypothetical protein